MSRAGHGHCCSMPEQCSADATLNGMIAAVGAMGACQRAWQYTMHSSLAMQALQEPAASVDLPACHAASAQEPGFCGRHEEVLKLVEKAAMRTTRWCGCIRSRAGRRDRPCWRTQSRRTARRRRQTCRRTGRTQPAGAWASAWVPAVGRHTIHLSPCRPTGRLSWRGNDAEQKPGARLVELSRLQLPPESA